MTKSAQAPVPDVERLRQLSGAHFRFANYCGGIAFTFQVIAVVCGVWPLLRDAASIWIPYLIATLAIATTFIGAIAENHKAIADDILRCVEAADGSANPLKARQVADWWADAAPLIRYFAKRGAGDGGYFASREPASARRTVENTYESAWWSAKLAKTQKIATWVGISIIAGAAILIFRFAASHEPIIPIEDGLVEAASAALMFLLTQAPLRKAIALASFERSSERIVEYADALLEKNSISNTEAIDLQIQYQLARRASPPLSTAIWKIRRPHLNAQWRPVAEGLSSQQPETGNGSDQP
jgi:hypothetical protein